MYCIKCENEIPDNSNFCNICGVKINKKVIKEEQEKLKILSENPVSYNGKSYFLKNNTLYIKTIKHDIIKNIQKCVIYNGFMFYVTKEIPINTKNNLFPLQTFHYDNQIDKICIKNLYTFEDKIYSAEDILKQYEKGNIVKTNRAVIQDIFYEDKSIYCEIDAEYIYFIKNASYSSNYPQYGKSTFIKKLYDVNF